MRPELIIDLSIRHGRSVDDLTLMNADILYSVSLPVVFSQTEPKTAITTLTMQSVFFRNCDFHDELILEHNNDYLYFENCHFKNDVKAFNSKFKGKVIFRNCEFHRNVIFENAQFNELADFWNSTFHKPITFFKTDFLATVVMSSVLFKENVLFTYTLFEGKTIFSRTKFKKGLDISQSIITGELQLFDLSFNIDEYEAEYIGNDDLKFRDSIYLENKIPLTNKVATFQILKNQFSKQGNFIDEIAMRKYEKSSFSQLLKKRKEDKDWLLDTKSDRFILWLNRWSNNHQSDFRNGIVFTLIVATLFMLLTFVTTDQFWSRLCFDCKFDWSVLGYSLKQFINFLNPVHDNNFIVELNPLFGIPYIFDFLGRIAVGYGVFQTVQAFRKFR